MILDSVREEVGGGLRRVLADVRWEDSDRRCESLFLEVGVDAPLPLVPSAAAFLPLVVAAANAHGERRVAVADPVDPVLLAGLLDATAAFRTWDGTDRPPLQVEAPEEAASPPPVPRTGLLLTGGIDSTASLVDNHRRYDVTHPRRITVGIVVYGLDASTDGDPRAPDHFLQALADRTGIALVAVRTNLRVLDSSLAFWWDHGQTAMWSSVSHALGPALTDVVVGSDEPITVMARRGSDPLLADAFSSTNLRMHHGVLRLTRLERLALVREVDETFGGVQVCNRSRSTWRPLNCGTCEKCIRTLLGTIAIGASEGTGAFPGPPSPEAVRQLRVGHPALRPYYAALAPLLESAGHPDLAVATRTMLRRSRWLVAKFVGRRIDDCVTGGAARRALRGTGALVGAP